MTVYILNQDLLVAGIAEEYKSLIWNNRYWNVGDFELALPASVENISMCQKGFYVIRTDDDMVGVIEKIEIDTSYDAENLLIVSGRDATALLYRRVMFGYQGAGSNKRIEEYLSYQITHSCITPDNWVHSGEPEIIDIVENRKMKKEDGTQLLAVDDYYNFKKTMSVKKVWANLGETVQEMCKGAEYGYKIFIREGMLHFRLYEGFDRSDTVFFAPEYDNLSSTKYTNDSTNHKNIVCVIGNDTLNTPRHIAIYDLSDGDYNIDSTNRYEMEIDATKDVPRVMTVADIQEMFSGAHRLNDTLIAPNVSVQIYMPSQEDFITDYYDGTITEVDGNRFFNFANETKVADLLEGSDAPDRSAAIASLIYDAQLYAYAVDVLASKKITEKLEGSVVPNVTYQYKRDYALGDIVTVRNEYGIEAQARIVEVLEVFDGNGYSIEPKFEYISG